jgi:4-hydroxy-tetrahydrodipicolinate synthase
VQAGDLVAARRAQARLAPLRNAFDLGSFPVVVKEGLQLLGLDVGPARLPIHPMSDENRRKLKDILSSMDLI